MAGASNKATNGQSPTANARAAKKTVTEGAAAPAKEAQQAATEASKNAGEAAGAVGRGGKEALTGLGGAASEKAKVAARTVQSTVASAAGQTVGKAGLAWTLLKARKVVAATGAAGTATVVLCSYTLGRRAGLRQRGPLSRLSGGRL
ncbi:hypothetical protein ACFS5L_31140 [Streptomyces phyllanthi]|uniref:Uncharacterized protein n=1 Tax=Streptomyces phyllanthi TaxID=1803180 RepID=A0A5N8WDM0_9ACTN|nr:hypothetical protein [Streptomyces phyllanthi]MPY44926.1 hypothetical protein [Streptomyces phyllanthi]